VIASCASPLLDRTEGLEEAGVETAHRSLWTSSSTVQAGCLGGENEGVPKMKLWEGWGSLCLMGCVVATTLSLTVLTERWSIVGATVGVALGILTGGLSAAAVQGSGESLVPSTRGQTDGKC
jgi:hypothetical protein